MILAGDIGGTKCNLGLFEQQGGKLSLLVSRRYATKEFSDRSFEAVIDEFKRFAAEAAAKNGRITAAAFGAAGAVMDGLVHGTHVPWPLEAKTLASHLGIDRVRLLNDVEAAALGLPYLRSEDVAALNAGSAPEHATRALLAAGTGLGESVLFWDGRRYRVLPTEGGEADFTPATDREIELLRFLRARVGRVRAEEILSGSGFRWIHEFLDSTVRHPSFSDTRGANDSPAADSAQEITQNAASGACEICKETVNFWIATYASEAGNLALRTLAYGGVYVGGGIAPKILSTLRNGSFARMFADKGRFGPVLARIPLYVVLNENAPLWGAAYEAISE